MTRNPPRHLGLLRNYVVFNAFCSPLISAKCPIWTVLAPFSTTQDTKRDIKPCLDAGNGRSGGPRTLGNICGLVIDLRRCHAAFDQGVCVRHAVPAPKQPKSDYPKSSARISTMFGRGGAAPAAVAAASNAVATFFDTVADGGSGKLPAARTGRGNSGRQLQPAYRLFIAVDRTSARRP